MDIIKVTCLNMFVFVFVFFGSTIEKNIAAKSPEERILQPQCIQGHFLHDIFVNVALNKTVTSAQRVLFDTKMVDGNTTNRYPCTHTLTNEYAFNYLMVDLGATYEVYGVYLFNKNKPNSGLHSVEVFLGETPDDLQLLSFQHQLIEDDCTIIFHKPIPARYVKVAKHGSEYLLLCELEVYSRP